MGSKPGPSKSTTQNSTLPQWLQDAQQNIVQTGQNLTSPFTSQAPTSAVYGLTPDQLLSGDLARQLTAGTFTKPSIPAYDVFGMGAAANGGYEANPARATAAQLKPGDISPMMNPFIDAALDPTLARLKQQQGEVQSGIGANAAAAHAFGGSREAVQRMLADRNYRDTVAQTVGNMRMSGFDKAAQLAQQNTANQQAANLTNAQLGTQTSLANANLGYNAQEAAANRFLQGLTTQSNLDTQDINSKMALLSLLNGFGTQQQKVGQASLDAPFQKLMQLIQATPGYNEIGKSVTGTESTTAPMDPLTSLLGIAGTASKFIEPLKFAPIALSDRDSKTDIEEVGIDPRSGLMLYAYRYKADPKTYPKVVGPMADEVEARFPGSTVNVGGKLVISKWPW